VSATVLDRHAIDVHGASAMPLPDYELMSTDQAGLRRGLAFATLFVVPLYTLVALAIWAWW
jgi:hypothetical protein